MTSLSELRESLCAEIADEKNPGATRLVALGALLLADLVERHGSDLDGWQCECGNLNFARPDSCGGCERQRPR